jgi:hypothetical protein
MKIKGTLYYSEFIVTIVKYLGYPSVTVISVTINDMNQCYTTQLD